MKCSKCKAHALKDSADTEPRCFFHSEDPLIVAKRKAAKQKGGRKGGKVARQDKHVEREKSYTITDLKKIISTEAIDDLIKSPTDNRVARARAIAFCCKTLADLIQLSELEERISALEAQVFKV